HAATPEEIDAPVVRDLEQPRGQRLAVVEGLESSIGLEERLLDDVLAVQHRAGHARAVPVQARTQARDRLQARYMTSLEYSWCVHAAGRPSEAEDHSARPLRERVRSSIHWPSSTSVTPPIPMTLQLLPSNRADMAMARSGVKARM